MFEKFGIEIGESSRALLEERVESLHAWHHMRRRLLLPERESWVLLLGILAAGAIFWLINGFY